MREVPTTSWFLAGVSIYNTPHSVGVYSSLYDTVLILIGGVMRRILLEGDR